ncbi:MAG: hypothetical protein Q4D79_09380 [Propionibacteriaceae bacterium]|nr:hypothetical protein [Propionibacteriaceae bacterium]
MVHSQDAQLHAEHEVQSQEPQEQATCEQLSQVQSALLQVAQAPEQLPQEQAVHSS